MPTWWVSEPYINLWAVDKPVEYTTSLGEQIAFTITYKQRDTRPALINGEKPYLAINGWNNNWYSYVHFIGAVATNEDGSFNCNDFTNWTATVYEPNGGESSFVASQSPDATSGDQLFALHGVDGNVFTDGFRLVHSDGSQDVYGRVTPMYPTNYLKLVTIYQDAADATAISAIWGSDGISYGGSSYEDITPEAIGNGGTLTFGTPANPATNYYSKISTWTNVMHSVTNYAVVSVPAGPSADALLTERIDPQGNALHFVYAITSGAYQLQSMVDYDGRTTTISYDTNGYITSVNMPYSRTATFQYAANTNAQLLNVTDAQGMSSSFTYTETFLNGMMTPYGTNRFTYYEAKDQSVTKPLEGLTRSLRVTRPDGAGEMYAFFASATNGTPFSYPTNQLPTPPTGVVLDNGVVGSPMSAMYRRNSYHWGPNQYELMSVHNPASLGQLNAYDFQLGRMRHWKMNDDGVTISSALSMEQAPSPDGSTAGLRTWYGGSWQGGDDEKPKYQMKLTPDGGTWTRSLAYHDQSDLLSYVSTSITDQSGNLSERYISYEYKNWNYSEVFSGQTFTWHGSWLSGISGPGFSTSINNDPDPLFVADSHPYSVSGYYPHYSEMHITDITGAHSTNYFNDRSQLTGRLLPTGLSTTILYGTDGFPSQSTAAEISAVNSYTFTNGLLASRTDPNGLLTTYSWDKLDRLTAVNYPDGTSLNYGYDKLDLTGHKDRLGYWATSSFDNMSRLTSVTDRNGKTTAYGRCTCGAITSITDPQTNTTTFDRNLVGWVNSMTFSGSTGSPTTRTFQRDSWGRATNITDDAGFNLNYSYNIQGLVTNVTSSQGIVYAATYDSADRPLTVCNSDGIWVTNAYDGAERLTDQTSAHGLSRHTTYSGWLRTATTDGFGNSIYFGYDPAGRLIATADTAFYHTNGFSYNPAGQMIALADGNGHVTQWDYDVYGRMIRKMDGNGVLVETNGYDSNGRVTARWTPAKELTHYSYDSNANLLSIAYNSGAGVTATYDGLNRVLTMSDAVGSSVFTYNGFGAFMGALATEDGPWASDTITHIYASRVPQSLTLGQPSGSWSETFGYDSLLRLQGLTSPAGNFTYNYSGAGRLVHGLTMPGSTSIANSFDDAGQLLSTALNHGGTLDSYAYAYDHNGNRLSVQRANNSVVNYGYDNLGQLTSALGLEPDGVTVRANENFGYGYDAAGNLAFRTNNTLAQVFITDPANQLMAVTRNNDLLTVAGSLSFAPTNLTVNGIGATIYQDLTFAVTNGVNIANGVNYLTNVVNGMLTNVARERLPVTVSQRYDQNGNLVWDGMKAFEYDCANELTRVTVTNGWQTEYAYDGFGRRRVKREYNWTGTAWSQTNEVHYVYDGMSVIQERDGSNNPKVTYTRGLDLSGTMQGAGGIGGLLARTDGSGSAYYHCDGNGNITMLTDASGNVLAKYLYDSFGNTLGMWGPLAATNTYRFSSKEIDARYGIYYYGYRYYEPNQQRWLNRDPIKEKGGINLYRMVGDNLVNQIDPLGLYNPISGSSGAVGAGSGLADPSLFLPPQLQPPSNNSSTSGGSGGYNSMLPLLVGGMSQAEKDYWSWKSIYDSQKDMLKRLPQDLKSPNKCADLTRTIDRMEALDGLPEAADGMGEATSAAIGETVGGAALGTAATVGFIVGGPIAAYYIGQNEADFYGGLLYSLCPTCF
ncbi:MAG: RHS repeat-associated core domain-containing protein [Verrucomicrobiota bacterium]